MGELRYFIIYMIFGGEGVGGRILDCIVYNSEGARRWEGGVLRKSTLPFMQEVLL